MKNVKDLDLLNHNSRDFFEVLAVELLTKVIFGEGFGVMEVNINNTNASKYGITPSKYEDSITLSVAFVKNNRQGMNDVLLTVSGEIVDWERNQSDIYDQFRYYCHNEMGHNEGYDSFEEHSVVVSHRTVEMIEKTSDTKKQISLITDDLERIVVDFRNKAARDSMVFLKVMANGNGGKIKLEPTR